MARPDPPLDRDRLTIKWRSDLWWTATFHLSAMVTATVFFGLAAILGQTAYTRANVSAGAYALTVVGFGFLPSAAGLGAPSSMCTGYACSTS